MTIGDFVFPPNIAAFNDAPGRTAKDVIALLEGSDLP